MDAGAAASRTVCCALGIAASAPAAGAGTAAGAGPAIPADATVRAALTFRNRGAFCWDAEGCTPSPGIVLTAAA